MRHCIRLTAVTLFAAAALTACSTDTPADRPAKKDTATTAPEAGAPAAKGGATADAKILKTGVENHDLWGHRAYVVHYAITNHGTGAADYYTEMEFLDRDGDFLGRTGVTADRLGAGKSTKTDTAPLDSEITNGKIADIRSARITKVTRTPVK